MSSPELRINAPNHGSIATLEREGGGGKEGERDRASIPLMANQTAPKLQIS